MFQVSREKKQTKILFLHLFQLITNRAEVKSQITKHVKALLLCFSLQVVDININ